MVRFQKGDLNPHCMTAAPLISIISAHGKIPQFSASKGMLINQLIKIDITVEGILNAGLSGCRINHKISNFLQKI